MLPKEVISQVKKIEIKTRRIVDEITGGAYHSVFKGRGIEFDEVREYTSEDDIRDIDWNVTARMGSPYIKKYVEERELTVILAVDASASGLFGSGEKSKRMHSVEIASLLAFSAIRNNDKVGLLLFTDKPELHLPPRSGRSHVLRLVRELIAFTPGKKGTDINSALDILMKTLHKKAVIFLISDLINPESIERKLKMLNKRHDLISVRVLDPLELSWPLASGLMLEDSETSLTSLFSGLKKRKEKFAKSAEILHKNAFEQCRKAKVDRIDIRCGEDYVKPLIKFFAARKKSRGI